MEKHFTSFAEQLADRAGEIARAAFDQARTITIKADKSFVTETDKAIEAALREMIKKQFHDHGIFGEEHGRSNVNAAYQWVIDPIDGTSAFIAGIPTFTTLIALCEDAIPKLGIIDQPILKERWVSTKVKALGMGHEALGSCMLAATSVTYFTDAETKKFNHLRTHCGGTVHGGDAYLFAKLADGRIDIVAEAGLKAYDFCAIVPVVEAAGGVITDWHGKPLHMHSDGTVLAAATPALHAQALLRLNDN